MSMHLMTRKEAAQRLRIGIRTLDRRLASGDLKCYRLGDGPKAPVRISEEQINEYLAAMKSDVSDTVRCLARAIMQGKSVGTAQLP
jgi:excisionase family DNA binding protein